VRVRPGVRGARSAGCEGCAFGPACGLRVRPGVRRAYAAACEASAIRPRVGRAYSAPLVPRGNLATCAGRALAGGPVARVTLVGARDFC